MKLTDEMIAAIQRTYPQYAFTVADGRAQIEEMFLAGYRMGERDMRERAVQTCYDERNLEGKETHDQLTRDDAYADACVDCADAIRSLPIEDEA